MEDFCGRGMILRVPGSDFKVFNCTIREWGSIGICTARHNRSIKDFSEHILLVFCFRDLLLLAIVMFDRDASPFLDPHSRIVYTPPCSNALSPTCGIPCISCPHLD